MEAALYGPGGYYNSGSPISASGDYFTAPTAHPLFGALIAVQLRQMWQLLDKPDEFTVVEEGAGNGGLAADIVETAAQLDSDFHSALRYVALDVVPPETQHYAVLPLAEVPQEVTGCLLSNELLDAMPVHRFQVQGGELLEVFVATEGDEFVEVLQPPSSSELERRLSQLTASLPDGYRSEINLGLDSWAQRQSAVLKSGWALTIDYGFERSVLYGPERTAGSLRTYYQHTLGQDPLLHPGEQDITAHVDFTAVDEAMSKAGFVSAGTAYQAEFLQRLGVHAAAERLRAAPLPRPQKLANQRGIEALIDPNGMGRFVVAAYSRNVETPTLLGLDPNTADSQDQLVSLPLLNPRRHIDLTGHQSGSYFEVPSFEDLFSDEP